MDIRDKNIIWLDLFPNLTYNKKKTLLDLFGENTDVRKNFLKNPKLNMVLNENEINKMSQMLDDAILNRYIAQFEKDGIIMITMFDPRYPDILKEIDTPPFCLYCKGNVQLLNTYSIGVVGSRKPTDYGIVVTKQFAKALAEQNITIVSGLATGVDSIAHNSALEVEGKTIAVLAGGLYHIYPASNYQLARKMSENNLLVTEYSPNVVPQAYYFPIRNRIIAGLSRAVLITEASAKSGALYTVDYAIEYNREIYAIPGKINSPTSEGCNNIISKYNESVVFSPDDIFNDLNIKKENSKNISLQLDMREQIVLDYIRTEKKTFKEIADHTGIAVSELNTILFNLEMNYLITKLPNNSYIANQN